MAQYAWTTSGCCFDLQSRFRFERESMIEQIRMLPMIERVPLFLAFCFFVIAYLVVQSRLIINALDE